LLGAVLLLEVYVERVEQAGALLGDVTQAEFHYLTGAGVLVLLYLEFAELDEVGLLDCRGA